MSSRGSRTDKPWSEWKWDSARQRCERHRTTRKGGIETQYGKAPPSATTHLSPASSASQGQASTSVPYGSPTGASHYPLAPYGYPLFSPASGVGGLYGPSSPGNHSQPADGTPLPGQPSEYGQGSSGSTEYPVFSYGYSSESTQRQTLPSASPFPPLQPTHPTADEAGYFSKSSQPNIYSASDDDYLQEIEAPVPVNPGVGFRSVPEEDVYLANDEDLENSSDLSGPSPYASNSNTTLDDSRRSAMTDTQASSPPGEDQIRMESTTPRPRPRPVSISFSDTSNTYARDGVKNTTQKIENPNIRGSSSSRTTVTKRHDDSNIASEYIGSDQRDGVYRSSSKGILEAGPPSKSNQGVGYSGGSGSSAKHSSENFSSNVEPREFSSLDKSYKRCPSKDFAIGKVFKTLWSEPAGGSESRTSNETQESFTTYSKYGEKAYHEIRRFVVIKACEGHALCLPIMTYGKRGTRKAGVKREYHAIIYTGDSAPKELEGEKSLRKRPIQVTTLSPRDKLDIASRLNYKKVYTVEHNLKVSFIGKIHPDSRARFEIDFQATFDDVKIDYQSLPPPDASNAD